MMKGGKEEESEIYLPAMRMVIIEYHTVPTLFFCLVAIECESLFMSLFVSTE